MHLDENEILSHNVHRLLIELYVHLSDWDRIISSKYQEIFPRLAIGDSVTEHFPKNDLILHETR